MNFNKNKLINIILILTLMIMSTVFTMYILKQKRIIEIKEQLIINMEDYALTNENPTKYNFLNGDVAIYIESLCEELNLDSDLVVAILMQENPSFDVNAINKNTNGTIDCGLFQLNDKYLWTVFKKAYWMDDVELDPFNWKHNSFIAIHHINYLAKKLKVVDDVIMAYNCGAGAVMNHKVPQTTKIYLNKVKNNMKLLKNYKVEE